MMSELIYIGWDVGGAHLKAAQVSIEGDVLAVEQVASPIWQGVDKLEEALRRMADLFVINQAHHVITMTGEMADIFPNRMQGVASILQQFGSVFPDGRISVYAGQAGLVSFGDARNYMSQIASMNWHATATLAARKYHDGILLDIGSTTTDIIPFRNGTVCQKGWTDFERLRNDELLYTGIVRTPVMAVVQRVPFRGHEQHIAAENFATMADVYRLTGELLEHHDLMETSDLKGKSKRESAQRLARMVGLDVEETEPLEEWIELARYIAGRQLDIICISLSEIMDGMPARALIGAGSGRFLARKLAQQANVTYIDFTEQWQVAEIARLKCADCATAIAVADLARLSLRQ